MACALRGAAALAAAAGPLPASLGAALTVATPRRVFGQLLRLLRLRTRSAVTRSTAGIKAFAGWLRSRQALRLCIRSTGTSAAEVSACGCPCCQVATHLRILLLQPPPRRHYRSVCRLSCLRLLLAGDADVSRRRLQDRGAQAQVGRQLRSGRVAAEVVHQLGRLVRVDALGYRPRLHQRVRVDHDAHQQDGAQDLHQRGDL